MSSSLKLCPILSCDEAANFERMHLGSDLNLAAKWMDQAALAVARYVLAKGQFFHTLILAGPGGNGGDGWRLARFLKLAGYDPLVIYFPPKHPLCRYHFEHAQNENIRSLEIGYFLENLELLGGEVGKQELIVDALLGIGAKGPLPGDMQKLIKWQNSLGNNLERISLDCPTGFHLALEGQAGSILFHANTTLCFQFIKKELLESPAKKLAGRLEKIDLHLDLPFSKVLMLDTLSIEKAIKERISTDPLAHKYTNGVIYIVAGNDQYKGASLLTESAALFFGPGMIFTTNPNPLFARSVVIKEPPKKLHKGVLVIGPGLGEQKSSLETLTSYLERSSQFTHIVVDASALFHLASHPNLWKLMGDRPTVLTPNDPELDRLLLSFDNSYQSDLALDDKLKIALAYCKHYKTRLVYKGPVTYLLGSKFAPLLVEPFGGPHLARGGSGDILAGMIGSALSKGLEMDDAILLSLRAHATQVVDPVSLESFKTRGLSTLTP